MLARTATRANSDDECRIPVSLDRGVSNWECNSLRMSKSAGGNIYGFSSLKMGLID